MKKFNFKTIVQGKNFRVLSLVAIALVALVASTTPAFAQAATGLGGGLSQAANSLKSYLPMVRSIIYAFAGLVFLVGAGSIYVKMSNGDQDVKSSIMMYVGGVLFLLIAANLADTLFR